MYHTRVRLVFCTVVADLWYGLRHGAGQVDNFGAQFGGRGGGPQQQQAFAGRGRGETTHITI
jgi:hypothetical protein